MISMNGLEYIKDLAEKQADLIPGVSCMFFLWGIPSFGEKPPPVSI